MKRFLTVIFGVLLLGIGSALAEESTDVSTQRLGISQASVSYQSLKIEVGMDTTISYIQGLGGDTAELETIRSDFATLADEVSGFTSLAGLRAGNAQMRDKVKEFKDAAKTLVEANGGDTATLKANIEAAVADDADVQAAQDTLASTVQSFLLDRFDKHLARLQKLYDKMSERYGESNADDVAGLQSILDSITAERDSLETAASSGDLTNVKTVTDAINAFNEEFVSAVKDLTGSDTSGPSGSHPGAIGNAGAHGQKAERILTQMGAAISDLTVLGYDVSPLQTVYDTAQSDYTAAESSGDYTTFKVDVKSFLDALKALVGDTERHVKTLQIESDGLVAWEGVA